ncbi:MAG: cytochrome c [Planctomycetaceae bacterium]
MVVALALAAAAWGADRTAGRVQRRAAPPPGFDKAAAATFFDDAFSQLEGPRPSFTTPAPLPGAAPQPGGRSGADGFAWSTLVSEETLTDEVKTRKADVAAAAAKPTDFKGGGYEKARLAFTSVALCFGVIAGYDRDMRWKKDAATARDLFGRAGFNCKVGTDQSYAESRKRLEDLESLLEGGSPQGTTDREDDFRWSQVVGRPALMKRLEAGETTISAGVASRGDFDRSLDRILHDAEIVAMIGHVIHQPTFEYHDDDTYRGYSATMRDAALKLREACRTKNYDAARSAAGDLKKSCDSCHGDYRG